MFFGNDDEDRDFNPREGSKLASLFGMDNAMTKNSNESLKYQAPKEPKKSSEQESGKVSGPQPSVLHAVAVFAYKSVDNKYTSQGKLGAAVIGNHTSHEYKLLLYVNKKQQVTHAVIGSTFNFAIQPGNYAAFYDSAQQSWSLKFDSQTQLSQFAKQVALAKVNSCGGGDVDTVITQDLVSGEGGGLETGDSVELKYTGSLLTDQSIGDVFDTNTNADKLLRFKVGKGKVVKGLEEGIIGLQKNGSRVVIVPPGLGYGAEGRAPTVPSGATLVYEVQAVRVKLAKERDVTDAAGSQSSGPTPDADVNPKTPTHTPSDQPDEDTCAEDREDKVTGKKTEKAKLISRIAKMGQAMFPTAADSTPEQDPGTQEASPDHQSTVKPALPSKPQLSPGVQTAKPPSPAPTARPGPALSAQPAAPVQPALPSQHAQQTFISQPMLPPQTYQTVPNFPGTGSSQLALYQSPLQMMQPQIPQPMYGAQPLPYQQPVSMATDTTVPLLLSETRQKNTEVTVSLTKMADKVDRISEKLENLYQIQQQQQQHAALTSVSMAPSMESAVLLHNIQRIVQENERLKKDVFEKSGKIESQNEKIADLLNRNQQYVEQSNILLEQRSDTFKNTAAQSQAKLLSLEQDKVHLTTELSTITSQLSALQMDLTATRRREGELRDQLGTVLGSEQHTKDQVLNFQVKSVEAQQESEQLSLQLTEERQRRKKLESELSNLKEDMTDVKSSRESLQKTQIEKKQKWLEDKELLDQELEDTKKYYEGELTKLKEKLKEQKSTSGTEAVQATVAEVNKEWKEKCDQLVSDAESKHQRAISEAQSQCQLLQETILTLEGKYGNLRDQASKMKENYEARIEDLQGGSEGSDKQNMVTEVKRIMSSVYHSLKGEFEEKNTYHGADIHQTIMDTIKAVTIQMMEEAEDAEGPETEADRQGTEPAGDVVEEPMISASVSRSTSGAPPPKPTKHDKPSPVQPQILADVIKCAVAPSTGDKGNPYYAAQLKKHTDKDPDKNKTEKDDLKEITADVIKSMVAPSAGDKGNPYYAQQLKNTNKNIAGDVVEEPMISASVGRSTSGAPPPKPTKHDKPLPVEPQILADVIKCAVAPSTGDKGNPYYAAQLTKQSDKDKEQKTEVSKQKVEPAIVADVIRSVVAPSTGDRGNPYYAAELQKDSVQEHAKTPTPSQHATQPGVQPQIIAEMIRPAVAHSTGDRGNRHYAAELDKENKVEEITKVIMKEAAPITGDRGNPYYAEELKKKGDVEVSKMTSEENNPHSAPVDINRKVDLLRTLVSETETSGEDPQHYTENLDEEGGLDLAETEPIIEPISVTVAPSTGGRGNPHYSAELDKAGTEPGIIPKITLQEASPPTGGWGNPYRAEEIQRQTKAKEIVANVISAVVAPSTGDHGNPYYAAELDEKDKADKTKSVPESDVKSQTKTDKPASGADSQPSKLGTEAVNTSGLTSAKPATDKQTPESQKSPQADTVKDKAADRSKNSQQASSTVTTQEQPSSDDDDLKPKPPPDPLFGSEDDEEDLDWLK